MTQIEILDIVLFILFIVGAVYGYRSGVVTQLSSLLGIAFTIFFYSKFYKIISNYLKPYVDNMSMLPYLSTGVLLFVSTLVSMMIGKFLHFFIQMTPMGWIDKLIGAILGSFKWVFFSAIFIWMIGMANKKINKKYISKSLSYKILEPIMSKLFHKMQNFSNQQGDKMKKLPKHRILTRKVNPSLDF